MIQGRGRGKVILLGEHAVVYGYPALAAALDRGAEAELSASSDDRLVSATALLNARRKHSHDEKCEQIDEAFTALLESFSAIPLGVCLKIQLEIPPGVGLGGSAATGIALSAAIAAHLGRSGDLALIESAALAWERVFHGTPSGVDTALALHGGVGLFDKMRGFQRVDIKEPLHIAIANSGAKTSTREMVEAVALRREQEGEAVDEILRSIGLLAKRGALALNDNDLLTLGEAMNENHRLLAGLGLSTPSLDALQRAALNEGALGAKLTGSGGGGALVALARSREQAEALALALSSLALETSSYEIKPW